MNKITFCIKAVIFAFFLASVFGAGDVFAASTCGTTGMASRPLPSLDLNFFPVSNTVDSTATNTLTFQVQNTGAPKTVSFLKGYCRCKEHLGYPYRTGLGQCQYYWNPESADGSCQFINEDIYFNQGETKTIKVSATQFRNLLCGSFQLDFFVDKVNGVNYGSNLEDKIFGASFTDVCQDCVSTPCVLHANKKCVGNAVYWFDFCGNQEELAENCSPDKICQNAQCLTVACATNSDCGTNGHIGDNFCQSGNVYQNFKTFTCNNPGTASSSCSSAIAPKLKTTCQTNQTCSNGICQNITCNSNSDCGTEGYIGDNFCQLGNVYQNFKTYTCNNHGTASSFCSNSIAPKLKSTCGGNQTCLSGACVNITVACATNSDCGTNGHIGDNFCQSGNVYQNFKTHTCNNPGTANSSCSDSTAPKLKTTCLSNQDCFRGSCGNITQNLIVSCYANPNPVNTNQQVSFIAVASGGLGSYLYSWTGACQDSSSSTCYNSFSQPGTQTAVAYVTSGSQTSNAVCAVNVNQNCAPNQQQRCVGNNLYWFDSCGNQQALAQYCQNGCQSNACIIQQNINVQTNSATNIFNNQATLNGYISGISSGNFAYVWFQWGTTASYGYEAQRQTQNNAGSFSQNIANLSAGTIYHFRAAAQNNLGNIFYGSDMTFTTTSSGPVGNLITITKKVRNLSSGNLSWAASMPASPSDVVMFMLEIKATGSQNVNNVTVKDILPANLNYKGQLTVAGSSNYTGDIITGLNLGTISQGQTITITYQAQVALAQNFNYGTTTLSNNAYVTGSGLSPNPAASAAVVVIRTAILGATSVSTGLTNNFLADSFFLPAIIALIGVWLIKSDLFGFQKRIDFIRAKNKNYKIEKELRSKIAKMRNKNV